MELGLTGKVVVVTGAAQGIGEVLAGGFAGQGCHVAMVDIAAAELERAAAVITEQGGRCRTYLCDIRDVQAVTDLVARIVSEMGVPDTLINNAAATVTEPFLSVTEEQWDRTLDTGLKGSFFLSQAVARQMMPRGKGVIIHMGSQLGLVAFKGRSAYGAMKGGIHHLTRCMALELGPHGIRVNAVAPCITETPSRRNLLEDPAYMAWVRSMLPIGRWAQPGDVLGPALFLASDHAAMITGHVLAVDGGWTIH